MLVLYQNTYILILWCKPMRARAADGWIQAITIKKSKQNWNAYLDWTNFCQNYSKKLTKITGIDARARDVEMTIWEAFKKGINLDII